MTSGMPNSAARNFESGSLLPNLYYPVIRSNDSENKIEA
jgi:hypothetical protein